MNLVPYEDALGLPACSSTNGETFPMAAWLANNNMAVTVRWSWTRWSWKDATTPFTIERPESESDMTDTTYFHPDGVMVKAGLDENPYEVVMAAGNLERITLGWKTTGSRGLSTAH